MVGKPKRLNISNCGTDTLIITDNIRYLNILLRDFVVPQSLRISFILPVQEETGATRGVYVIPTPHVDMIATCISVPISSIYSHKSRYWEYALVV